MAKLHAPLVRGLVVVTIGVTLAISHIAFAAAAPRPIQVASTAVAASGENGPSGTSSISAASELAENCYVDTHAVKGVRGKTVVTTVHECD